MQSVHRVSPCARDCGPLSLITTGWIFAQAKSQQRELKSPLVETNQNLIAASYGYRVHNS